jgi:hypothetical protein
MSWPVMLLGYVLLIGGMVLVDWAETVNRFFEPVCVSRRSADIAWLIRALTQSFAILGTLPLLSCSRGSPYRWAPGGH